MAISMYNRRMIEISIYCLIDPRSGLPFYVGKTNNPKVRLKSHRDGKGITPCSVFIREIKADGFKPEMSILERCQDHVWRDRESYWVNHYIRIFGTTQIKNVMDGGVQDGYYGPRPQSTRDRLRQIFKGRPIPQVQREQISRSLTGLKQTETTVSKRLQTINANRIARGLEPRRIYATQEEYDAAKRESSKIKRRETRRLEGRPKRFSEEWKEKQREGVKRWAEQRSEEDKQRQRQMMIGSTPWNKGRKFGPQSDERRALQSAKLKAYIGSLTPEQKEARMTAARAARKAKLGY